MLNLILANIIAGFGLFFSGLRLVDTNLRQAAGRRLRTIIGRLTRNAWVAGILGTVIGAFVPSSSGIVFILVSLTASGLTTVRRALPIVTWANVGCCALIFVGVIDLRLTLLYLIGVAGTAFAFDRSHRNVVLGAVFGIGLMFYGIELMKAGVEPLKEVQWFADLLVGNHSYILAFLIGAAFSFLTQSSTAVAMLVIGLGQTALIGTFPAMMALYGANVGSTFARMVLSSALTGSARQLTAFQDVFKISSAALFVPLLYLEAIEGVPLVRALVTQLSPQADRQLAFVFLLVNLTTAVLFSVSQSGVHRLLQRLFPAGSSDDLSHPQFLYDEALNEPATALDLIEREQVRLARNLLSYSRAMRAGPALSESNRAAAIYRPFAAVAKRTEQFQHELLIHQLGPNEMERITRLQSQLSLIVYLEDSLRALATAVDSVASSGRLADLVSTFVEGLDFILLTMVEALETKDADTVELLTQITGDRGELVERMRQDYLNDTVGTGPADRATLLQVTNLFERIVWMVQRLARLIENGRPKQAIVDVIQETEPQWSSHERPGTAIGRSE